jgi:rubrerythrin
MSLVILLDLAIELEKKVGECYDRMSGMTTDEALRTGLLTLAREEVDHANLLRTGKNFAVKNPEFFAQGEMGNTLLESCLRVIGELLNQLGDGAATLKGALSRIVALEYFCEKAHVSSLVHIEEPSLKQLFTGLARDDAAHAERVWQLLRKFPSAV